MNGSWPKSIPYAICFFDSSGWQHLLDFDKSVVVWICPIAYHVYLLICLSSTVLNVALAKIICLHVCHLVCVCEGVCLHKCGCRRTPGICLSWAAERFYLFFHTLAYAALVSSECQSRLLFSHTREGKWVVAVAYGGVSRGGLRSWRIFGALHFEKILKLLNIFS